MKCPRCGTTNGKTNRFCRGCGLQLEDLALQEPERQVEVSSAPDELALGEELFEVWQVYSRGELDAALAKVEKILQNTPGSASAHSILALIYERKADSRLKAGAEEEVHDLLKLAITQYERIIDLNPDSAADREKLASLRMRLAGPQSVRGAAAIQPAPRAFGALKAVPAPVWAAFAAFLVVLMTAIILIPGGEKKRTAPARSAGATKLSQVSTPGAASEGAGAPGDLRVYTFPGPSSDLASALPPTSPPTVPRTPSGLTVPTEPAKLPSIVGANVKIVPESKGATKPGKEPGASGRPVVLEEKPSTRPEGDTALARAVQFRRQGATQDAAAAAQEAIRLYQADIDAGRNVTSAKRGMETARKIVQVSQESSEAQ